jgi:hypothetical protein
LDRQDFVDAVRLAVKDAAVTGTVSQLARPPGRKPDESLLGLSAWFNQLAPQDRNKLEQVIDLAANLAVFGFLCVLDGVRAIEDGPTKGTLQLHYCLDSEDIILNDDRGEMLHDLL